MSMKVFGASGHGKVLYDIARVCAVTVSEFVDDDLSISTFCALRVNGPDSLSPRDIVIIGIGNNSIRRVVAERVRQKGVSFSTLIHPRATIAHGVSIGEGSVAMAGAVVNSDTLLGEHVILNTCSSVDHDCEIGDFVHISPGATICGGVTIGQGTHVGAGATVIPGITIGENCTIGAGATVVSDIPSGSTAIGTPARVVSLDTREIYLFGAGGFGKEIQSHLKSFSFEFAGFVDEKFGKLEDLDNKELAICIGSSRIRKDVVSRIQEGFENMSFPNLIHSSVRDLMRKVNSITMGTGNIICADSWLTTNISLGDFNIINLNCTIGHGTEIGDFVSLMPSVNIGGDVNLEDEAYIGTNATILPGIRIGRGAVVAAGAVVTKDVPPNTTVKGVPAK